MPHLNGPRVKNRMAARGFRYVRSLAEAARLPYGSLRNAITCTSPGHPINLSTVYVLAQVLRASGESVEAVVADITSGGSRG